MRAPSAHAKAQERIWVYDPHEYGSAEFASAEHLLARGYGPGGAHTLGYLPPGYGERSCTAITYTGDRHETIAAPTRGGKSVSGAVVRLLEHLGSAIVVDIKDGELARITARYRRDVLGQRVSIIDPHDIVASELGFVPAMLNPLQGIDIEDDDAFDRTFMLADACVVPDGHGESHWSAEAAALIAGLSLYEIDQGEGTLGGVRATLNLPREGFEDTIARMMDSDSHLVRAAGGRIDNKAERELSGVVSTAHRNTHFLESTRLAASLSSSHINLAGIGENTTLYIVLPARYIGTAKGWLRILVSTLIYSITALKHKPSLPVMFLLEEMAALERMRIIEQSFGLMAGYGLQLVAIVQDFTQLKDIYGTRWESFIANSASVQCFGTNDRFTAEYLSALCGDASAEKLSEASINVRASLFGAPDYKGWRDGTSQRRLITPDELMSLHPAVQLIKLAAARPSVCYRPVYFLEKRFRDRRGLPLYDIHPHHAGKPIPQAHDFEAPGLDLGGLLEGYLRVG